MTDLVVAEVFGPTFQGEGPSAGRRAGFVRVGRCPLSCSWCDTAYTWDWDRFDPAKELSRRGVDDVLAEVDAMDVDLVVITGGEPLGQRAGLSALARGLHDRGTRIEVETSGVLAPSPDVVAVVDQWNVSPKLANSGMEPARRIVPDALAAFVATGRAIFKFVVVEPADLDEIAGLVDEHRLRPVWVMPEGTDAATLAERLRALAEPVLARGWHLTPRLHVLLWGDRRGV
ncbi:MAG: queE [Acidimicrobiales bacterium]|nr:queE [Acidimicrobiales bacterium]